SFPFEPYWLGGPVTKMSRNSSLPRSRVLFHSVLVDRARTGFGLGDGVKKCASEQLNQLDKAVHARPHVDPRVQLTQLTHGRADVLQVLARGIQVVQRRPQPF